MSACHTPFGGYLGRFDLALIMGPQLKSLPVKYCYLSNVQPSAEMEIQQGLLETGKIWEI